MTLPVHTKAAGEDPPGPHERSGRKDLPGPHERWQAGGLLDARGPQSHKPKINVPPPGRPYFPQIWPGVQRDRSDLAFPRWTINMPRPSAPFLCHLPVT
jgi:hypothetical protein